MQVEDSQAEASSSLLPPAARAKGLTKGIDKPVVVSLAGDVEVEEAFEYLFAHKIPAYPYSTEIPVDVLGAK